MDEKELQNLYKAVSAKFDVGDYKTFTSKMSTTEQRKKFYDVVGSKGFDLGDYGEYEKRLGKQNEVSSQGSKNTSQTSTEPLPTSQNNPFNLNATVPTINVATGKTGQAKVTAMNDRIAKVEKKGTDVKNTLGASLNDLYSGLAKTPRYIFDLFSAPQNLLSEAFKNPALATDYDAFLNLMDVGAAGTRTVSPLSLLDNLGDYYSGNAQAFKDKQVKYDKGIYDSLKDGDFSNAGSQLINQIAGSAPSIALMAGTSGIGSVSKLGAVSKTMVNALPFASSKANEIRDSEEIPNWLKPIYSGANGLAEVVFDQKFGTQAIINKLVDKFKNEGREIAVEEGKKFVTGYLTKALKGIKEPLTDLGKNAVEEMATTLSQNIIDKATINPDKDLMEGVFDAGIVAGAIGGGISGVGAVISPKSKAVIAEKTKAIGELTNDLDSDIPEATKETILSQVGKLKNEVQKEITKADEQFEALEESDKEKAIDLGAKIDSIDKSLAQEGISETTKTVLTEQKTALEEQLAEIKPVEAPKIESEVITPVEEVKVTEDVKIPSIQENKIITEDGETIDIKIKEGSSGSVNSFADLKDKDNIYLTASNSKNPLAAQVYISKTGDGKYHLIGKYVDEKFKDKGILEALQQYAKDNGIEVVSDVVQTEVDPKTLQAINTKIQELSIEGNEIPINKIFFHKDANPERPAGRKIDELLRKERTNKGSVPEISEQVINIENIIPTQPNVRKDNIINLQSEVNPEDFPVAVKEGNEYYLIDGHHRVATEILQGKKSVSIKVLDLATKNVQQTQETTTTPTTENVQVKPKFTIKGETVTPKVDVANPVVPVETEELAQKKRASVQRVLKSPDYSQEFKDSLSDKTILYTELPNKITEKEAQAMIDVAGEAETLKSLYDFNNGVSSAVRFTVMQKLIDNYEEVGEYEKAGELAQELYSRGTDYGQGIQIFATFPKLNSASQLAIAEKNVRVKRDIAKKASKRVTDEIVKNFKTINRETAKETTEKVQKTVDKILNEIPPVEPAPKTYGNENKIVTKDKYKEALKNLRKKSFSVVGGVPLDDLAVIAAYHVEASGRDFATFSKRMISDVGTKIKPYLKELYSKQRENLKADEGTYLTDEEIDATLKEQDGTKWKQQLDKALQKADKKALRQQEQAIAKLQDISKEEGLWGQYKESAVSKLKGMVKTNIQTDRQGKPSLQEFTDDLVKNMRAKMSELLPEQTRQKTVARPDIEIIADAYKNVEKYQDVWTATQEAFQEKYAEQPEVLESIDAYFGEILDKPFNEKSMSKAVMSGLKDMGKNINDIIIQHYTVSDAIKQDLADKLVEQAGLTGKQATELSTAVQEQFDKIATKKKQQALDKIFSKRLRKKPELRTLSDDIIRLSNLGAFTNNELSEAYADKMGFPKLTDTQKQEIIRLSNIVQNTKDSIAKRRATEDLLAYQAKIKGWSFKDELSAVWYANVLSGYNTQIVNFGANAINTGLLYLNAVARKPSSVLYLARGLAGGLKRGLLEARETLRTGYSPIKGAPEIPTQLELRDFIGGMKNPYNYLKYVRRIMIAADVIFFEGQKEMRAYQLAKQQASNEGKVDPTMNMVNRQLEILGRNDLQRQAIEERVELEYEQQLAEIETANLSPTEKKSAVKLAERDKQRKLYDYIEQERPSDIVEDSSTYAARGTYNYKPQGTLGATANFINTLVADVPILRYAVPFTNIIANVANETIDYTPIGFIRRLNAGNGGRILSGFRREALTDNQKVDLTTKAVIGTVMMSTMMLLSQPMGEDDEPLIEITANGTGDFAKNEALAKTGWQPYSIRVKRGNGKYTPWMSYQYSPLIASLGFVGHFNDLTKYKEQKDSDTISAKLSKSAGLTVSTFFQATYLAGLGDLLQSVLDPRSSESSITKALKGGIGAIKGLAIPNLYSQVAQAYERAFDVPKKEVRETLLGAVTQDIPYARNAYYDKVNLLGDPVAYDTDKFLSLNQPDKLVQLLVDKKAIFAPPSRKIEKTYDMETGKERMLTDEEFYLFTRTKGQEIKKQLEARYDELSKLEIAQFKKELTKIKKDATKIARSKVANGEDSIFEIEGKEDGKSVTYKLTPAQALDRNKAIEKYVSSDDAKRDLEAYINDYMTFDKLDRKTATEKAKMDVRKDALKVTGNEILDKGFKLEIKE